MNFETKNLHQYGNTDPLEGSTSLPLYLTSTYRLPKFGPKLFEAIELENDRVAHVYTRWSNPTLRALEKRLALLEKAEASLVFASGMAAISALFFGLLSSGDHIIASEVCYAGTVELLGIYLKRYGIEVSLVDTSEIAQVQSAIRPNTRLVFVETPANPILRISDIQAIAKFTQERRLILAVDSTFASPFLQNPILLGADLVVHSLTKYINGHGDALGGVIMGRKKIIQQLRKDMLIHLGGAMSPFNAWLISRGLDSLPVRMKKHSENAKHVASFLEQHPKVERVYYPGLNSHPQHRLAESQMMDFGGMLAFRLKGGLASAISLVENVKIFTYATSLGHTESLLFYDPFDLYTENAPYYDPENKARIREWIGDGLMRASIGLENSDDLIEDLDNALRTPTFKGLIGPLAFSIIKRATERKKGKRSSS
jgi:cystathionine gamma-synthase/methionine-gamma-lyase